MNIHKALWKDANLPLALAFKPIFVHTLDEDHFVPR